MPRREYCLTDEERDAILKASKPVPYIVIGGVPPRSPQENANDAWRRLGGVLGFDSATVQGVPGKSDYYFTAVPAGTP